jgi:large subunit ribosomal protein L17
MAVMRKFHRVTGRRRAFYKGIAANLILRGKITTTVERAKEIKPIVERYVTYGKTGQTAKLRALISKLPKTAAEKMFYEIAPKYKDRTGGYLRITKKASQRMRDGAKMATIEFV